MEATLIQVPTESRHRRAACTAALLLVGIALGAWPHLTMQAVVIRPFVPIFATTVALSEALTAFLLWTQYRACGWTYFAALAGAYAFTSVAAALHLAVYPGVFVDAPSREAGRQTAVWIWLLWRSGFASLATLALVSRPRLPAQVAARRRGFGLALIVGSIALSITLCRFVIVARATLPNLVASEGMYRHLSANPATLLVAGVCFAALAIHVWATKLRSLMDLWLAVALFAGLADVVLTLGAGARYSVGWYAARIASTISASALLGMLMFETSRTYLKLADAHRALKAFSVRDGLTGVFNRAYFDERYPRELAQATATTSALTILLVDVDHFKLFNDGFGHLAGDECLRRIAQTLNGALTHRDEFVARYGGEEFVVVLPASDSRTGAATAERLRLAVAALEMTASASSIAHVTVSIGQASSDPGTYFGPANLLATADAALYHAKTLGRNRVEGPPAPCSNVDLNGPRAVYAS